jgi:hypothetical protein
VLHHFAIPAQVLLLEAPLDAEIVLIEVRADLLGFVVDGAVPLAEPDGPV